MPRDLASDGHFVIRGARTHNLKNVDVTLPAEKLIVVTGVSGSGKSSLAFDTLYAEGQRRYVESLSAYARQFLERMKKPDVDCIDGICPAIAIRQKNSLRNPRSTVGTTTEVHDYLRLLFARVGRTMCRQCGTEIVRQSPEIVARELLKLPPGTRLLLGFEYVNGNMPDMAVPAEAGMGQGAGVIGALRKKGFGRVVVDGRVVRLDDADADYLTRQEIVQVVVDRLVVADDLLGRITDSVETCYSEGTGTAFAMEVEGDGNGESPVLHRFSERFDCRDCGIGYERPQPRLFSFNSPFGACPTCHGFGNVIELDMNLVVPDDQKSIQGQAIEPWAKPHYRSQLAALKRATRSNEVRLTIPWCDLTDAERQFVVEGNGADYTGIKGFFSRLERKKYKVHVRVFLSRYRGYVICHECEGTRLRREARDVLVGGMSIDEVCGFTIGRAGDFFDHLVLTKHEQGVAERVIPEIRRRLSYLRNVGLDYLTLDRLSSTLSGGEAQRINLATALGSSLVGTLYVLDEPSIGLHPRDNERLIAILQQLRDQGNTVLVVEHDADTIRMADIVVDLGLGAGEQGGRIIHAGTFNTLLKNPQSLTAKYLRGDLEIPVSPKRRKHSGAKLRLAGAREHNLQGIDVEIPMNMLTCVTGVSGSGKSTLVHDVLYAAIKRRKGAWDKRVGVHDDLEGVELVSDVTLVDQTPIGRTPRSNPVTYIKAFDAIRELFSKTKAARDTGLTASHFSFNIAGGRCDVCEGEGVIRVEMQFLADVFVPCDECDGRRFKKKVLDVTYRGRSVDAVLQMTVREALSFFSTSPRVVRRLRLLEEVGLGYLRLGQPATTLSGGEAQRIKIASHLSSKKTERALYILDEPTTGLHFDDIAKLLSAFRKLLQAGNSLLVIEHNLDVIKSADWIIDLGPEGGENGGLVVAEGTPEEIVESPGSHTGRYLKPILEASRVQVGLDSSGRD